MDALEFIRERNRMCKSFGYGEDCMSCPVYKEGKRCTAILWKEEIIPIVEKWSKENPRKTRQDVFLKQWPEAYIHEDGYLDICPFEVSGAYRDADGCCATLDRLCPDCRREFWMQEVE